MRRLWARILFQALWQPWRAQLGQIWDKGPRWTTGQVLPRLRSLLLPNLVSGMSDVAPDFKGRGEKWFFSVFMAASALLYRSDLEGWADGQLARLGLSKDVRSRSRGGPSWRGGGLCSLGWPLCLHPTSLASQELLARHSPKLGLCWAAGDGGRLVPWDPPRHPASAHPLLPLGRIRGRTQRGGGGKELKAAKQLFCHPLAISGSDFSFCYKDLRSFRESKADRSIHMPLC